MNIVGTPLKQVIFSLVMHDSDVLAEKYGMGHIVVPCVMDDVIDNVAMREHDALGESCGPRRVLHVADVVGTHGIGHALHLVQRNRLGALERLLEREAAGHLEIDGDDVAQEGQLLAVQGLARLGLGDLGAQLVDDLHIVGIERAVDHDQRVGVALAQ